MGNPRMHPLGDHFERTFRFLELESGRVREIYGIINDCLPKGDYRDWVGGTARQLLYIRALSGMDADEYESFLNLMIMGGGLSLTQCAGLIDGLKERKKAV